jgi:hypothetical protein
MTANPPLKSKGSLIHCGDNDQYFEPPHERKKKKRRQLSVICDAEVNLDLWDDIAVYIEVDLEDKIKSGLVSGVKLGVGLSFEAVLGLDIQNDVAS